jgi:MFS transporter, FHS family, L-fucose permease
MELTTSEKTYMFPTIFALGGRDLGANTKKGSSFIIMSIVGGAIVPYVMGSFEETALAFTVPLICYVIVFLYGIRFHKIKHATRNMN